ncbi:MAG: hypothetical protein IPJ03_05390 [Ignavibacteriales bacterium]|nr:hypothetical protein [Ignavibacteriales bacterium]
MLKLYLIFLIISIFLSCSQIQQTTYQTVHIDSIYVRIDNDDEIKLKLYLADKYHPGDCYGMPSIRNSRYERKISPELLIKVKELLPNKTENEYDELIKQMNRIGIEQVETNEYNFFFKDGKCCWIIHYKGKLIMLGNTIYEKETEKTIEDVPC